MKEFMFIRCPLDKMGLEAEVRIEGRKPISYDIKPRDIKLVKRIQKIIDKEVKKSILKQFREYEKYGKFETWVNGLGECIVYAECPKCPYQTYVVRYKDGTTEIRCSNCHKILKYTRKQNDD